MSVINQMLNDIEQREQERSDAPAQKLDALVVAEPRSIKKQALILLILIVGAVLLWLNRDSLIDLLNDNQSTVPTKVVPAKVLPAQTAEKVAADIPIVEMPIINSSEPKQVLDKATTNNNVVNPPVVIDEVVISPIDKTNKQQVGINSNLAVDTQAKVKVAASNSPVTNNKVVVKDEIKPKAKAKAIAKVGPQLSIEPVALSFKELAALKYRQGLKLQSEGKLAQAQASWQQALRAQASLHSARESLAASFYGGKDSDTALTILQQGNEAYPAYQGYRLLMAQILFQGQQHKRALTVLANPYLTDSASNESLALAASIAQHLQLWPQAHSNYLVLNTRQPHQPKWLIGLAISLDGQQQTKAAIDKYQQFIAIPNSDESLYQYAKGRIAQLNIAQQKSLQ